MGIYAIMNTLPCNDPGPPTAVSVSSATPTNSNVAKGLQPRYPQVFSHDLEHYNLAKASLQLKPGTKPIFHPKRPVPYATFADPDRDQSDDLRTLFGMFGLEQPSPQRTATTLNREHRRPVRPAEPNQGDHQTRRPTRVLKWPRRLNVGPQRRTYDDANS
ncbi:unnamed protein product [Toxocara canis]|uniref:Mediator of RNA polymerase II transcription subunit 19 n=1 Tax=Toxocara canis TaxID=6265 RepID=A0A183TYM4_TOXCA|nr:unnamed protein product [Toxocara canis]